MLEYQCFVFSTMYIIFGFITCIITYKNDKKDWNPIFDSKLAFFALFLMGVIWPAFLPSLLMKMLFDAF